MDVSAKGGGDFELVPPGVYVAVCDRVIDLGKQESGNPKFKSSKQVYIRWNLPAVRIKWTEEGGEEKEGPAIIGAYYTQTLGRNSKLLKMLQSLHGKPLTAEQLANFDVFKLLGHSCQVSIMHEKKADGGERAIINAIMPLPAGQPRPQSELDPIGYSIDGQSVVAGVPRSSPEVHAMLSEYFRGKIDSRIVDAAAPGSAAPAASGAATTGADGYVDPFA